MPKRFSNIFSRAIERADQTSADGADGSDAAQDARDQAIDSQSARILPMPNRRPFNAKSDSANALAQKQVDSETWNWSQPPQLSPNLEKSLAIVNKSVELLTNESEEISETASEALTPTTHVGLARNSRDALSKIDGTSFHLAERPTFRTVAVTPEQVEPHLVAITDPRSPHCEEFRNLRTRILHASYQQKLQAITIASGSPSEGKSTVALNLAWLLAQTDGISALIIDSDLRLPCLTDYLNIPQQIGLSEIFSGKVKFEEAIIRLEPSGLHLLPGGARRDDVAEMLSGNRFRAVLEQARKIFDYIIVDAPSLGIFTDAAVLINQTDAALLVVRAGKTRFSVTNRLLETLPRERMFGVVLNGSDEGLANESHYNSYYYQNRRRSLPEETKEA